MWVQTLEYSVPGPCCQAYISPDSNPSLRLPNNCFLPSAFSSHWWTPFLISAAGTALPLQGTKLKRGCIRCPGGETEKHLQTRKLCCYLHPHSRSLHSTSTLTPTLGNEDGFPPPPPPFCMSSHAISKEIGSWLPEGEPISELRLRHIDKLLVK